MTNDYEVLIKAKSIFHNHWIETKEDIEIMKLLFEKIIRDAEKHIEKIKTNE